MYLLYEKHKLYHVIYHDFNLISLTQTLTMTALVFYNTSTQKFTVICDILCDLNML